MSNIKNNMQIAKQHITGKVQQVVGTVEKKMGKPVQGTITSIKGNANVAVSKVRAKIEDTK